MRAYILTLGLAIVLLPFYAVWAGPNHAHEHGLARLVITQDDTEVTVEFTSDLWNLAGFERAPRSAEEAAALKQARLYLETDLDMLTFNARAKCERQSMTGNFDNLFSEPEEPHDHHHADDKGGKHTEVKLTYTFSCAEPKRLTSLSVSMFNSFELLQDIDAIAFVGNKQAWHRFKRGSTIMKLD